MPICRTVLESLQWNLADERPFGFQQWSKNGDGWQSRGQNEPSIQGVDN